MSTRAPTAFDFATYNDEMIKPRKPILASTWDTILDNQEFCFGQQRIILTDFFIPRSTTSGTYVRMSSTHYFIGRDLMGTDAGAGLDLVVYVWAWSDGTGSNFSLRVNFSGSSWVTAYTTSLTNPTVRLIADATPVNITGDDTVENFSVDAKRDSGADNIYVAGFSIFG